MEGNVSHLPVDISAHYNTLPIVYVNIYKRRQRLQNVSGLQENLIYVPAKRKTRSMSRVYQSVSTKSSLHGYTLYVKVAAS